MKKRFKNKITYMSRTVVKTVFEYVTYKLIILAFVAFYTIYLLNGYTEDTEKKLNKYTKKYLDAIVTDSIDKVKLSINDEFRILNNLSLMCDDESIFDISNNGVSDDVILITKNLEESLNNNNYVGLRLYNKDKVVIATVGENIDNGDAFFEKVLSGKNEVSGMMMMNDKSYLSFAVPVSNDDGIIGVLSATYEVSTFTEMIDTSSFGQIGNIFISQSNGNLIAGPNATNENNLFTIVNVISEKASTKLEKGLKNNQSGIVTIKKNGNKRYFCYNVIPDTNWYAIAIVSEKALSPVPRRISNNAIYTINKIIKIFVLSVVIIIVVDIISLIKSRKKEKDERKMESYE